MMRKRPLFWIGLGFALGIAWQPCGQAWIGLLCTALVTYALRRWWQRQGVLWVVMLLSVVIGWGYAEARWQQLPFMLDEAYDQAKGVLRGRISGFPKREEDDWILRIEQVRFDNGIEVVSLPGAMQLRLYAEDVSADGQYAAAAVAWQPGDIIQLQAKLGVIRPGSNFGDPDWSVMFRRQGIVARASGSIASAELCAREDSSLQLLFWKVRRWVVGVYTGHPQPWLERHWVELLAGLTIGSTDSLPEAWDTAFRDAGVIHLLIVSGGHFALLIVLLRRVLRFVPMSLGLERCLMALAIVAYTVLTGAQDSILRAGIMALLMIGAEVHMRRTEWPSLLVLSMLLMLLRNPFALFSAGFQLSYAAVAGLCLWTNTFTSWISRLSRGRVSPSVAMVLGGTLAAQLAVLPIGIVLFNQVSLIAPLSNVLCSGLVVPIQALGMALLALHPIGGGGIVSLFLVRCAQLLMFILVWLAEGTAKLPLVVWNVATPPGWLVILSYAWMLACTYLPASVVETKQKVISTALCCSILLICMIHPWPYPLELVAIDVGQGDALFLRLPNGSTALIDGGGAANYVSDVGHKVVLPFLKRQGIQKLDLAIITHAHEDHYQGVLQVYERFPVAFLAGPQWESGDVLPEQLHQWLLLNDPPYLALQTGAQLVLDEKVRIDVRSGNAHGAHVPRKEVNNTSIVLRIHYGLTVLWLTGDAEISVEQALLAEGLEEQGNAVALKIGHHGSSTSSSEAWLKALAPRVALISAGRYNSYGHPTPEVLQRLDAVHCLVRRTDLHGSIRLQSNGQQWRVDSVFVVRDEKDTPRYARRDLHFIEDSLRQRGIWCYDISRKRRHPTAKEFLCG